MKKTRYRFAALAAAAVLIVSGCGSEKTEESVNAEPAIETIEKIEFRIGYDGGESFGEELRTIAEGFNNSQELYTAVVDEHAGEWKQDAETASIVFTDDDTAASYADDEKRLDLRPLLETENGAGMLYDTIGTLPDNMYATVCDELRGIFYLPVSVTGPVFYYNKTVYDGLDLVLPKSYSQLRDNCLAIYARHRTPGYLPYDLEGDIAAMMREQEKIAEKQEAEADVSETESLETDGFEADPSKAESPETDSSEAESTDDDVLQPAMTDAEILQFFAGSCEAGYFRMVQHETYAAQDFSTGAVASYAGKTSDLEMAIGDVTFDVGATPWIMDAEDAVYWVDTDGMLFLDQGDGKNEGAAAYAAYVLGDEVCSAYLEVTGGLSPYSEVYESQAYRKNRRGFDEITSAVAEEMPKADFVMLSEEKRRQMDELLLYIIDDRVTPEDAVTIMNETI